MKKMKLELSNKRTALKEKLSSVSDLMKAIEGSGDEDARNFKTEERAKFDILEGEIEDLESEIKDLERMISLKEKAAKEDFDSGAKRDVQTPEAKVKKRYSFLKAIRSIANREPLEGLEKEMHEEAVREAKETGTSVAGIGVPSMLIDLSGKRDLEVATAASAGDLVATELGGLIPALRPQLMVRQLGAQVLSNLQGDLELPRQTGVASAQWEGEKTDADETEPTFEKIKLQPKRLAAYTNFTHKLMHQSSISVEQMVQFELQQAIQLAVDAAAINGSGVGDVPLGLLNVPGIGNVVVSDPDGGQITYANLVALETLIATQNADIQNMAFLTTPGVRGNLKSTKLDAGSGLFIWPNGSKELLGYRAEVSTQVPSNLTKGGGTNLNAVMFGDWSQLMIGQWGGVDLVVDPYTQVKKGIIVVTVNSFWDIKCRQPKAFSAIVDAAV